MLLDEYIYIMVQFQEVMFPINRELHSINKQIKNNIRTVKNLRLPSKR